MNGNVGILQRAIIAAQRIPITHKPKPEPQKDLRDEQIIELSNRNKFLQRRV